MTPQINLTSGPPRVRLQSVLDHQFRIEFPSTGKQRDPSIPGARHLVPSHFLGLACSPIDLKPNDRHVALHVDVSTSFHFDVTTAHLLDGPSDCDVIMKMSANGFTVKPFAKGQLLRLGSSNLP